MFNWLKRKEEPKTEEEIHEQQEKVEEGLTRTRRGLFRQVVSLFEVDEITEDIWEDLETLLIQADLAQARVVGLRERLQAHTAPLENYGFEIHNYQLRLPCYLPNFRFSLSASVSARARLSLAPVKSF